MATEMKTVAKSQPGSYVAVDRRSALHLCELSRRLRRCCAKLRL